MLPVIRVLVFALIATELLRESHAIELVVVNDENSRTLLARSHRLPRQLLILLKVPHVLLHHVEGFHYLDLAVVCAGREQRGNIDALAFLLCLASTAAAQKR